MTRPLVSVAVFAYNEEERVVAALDRLDACGTGVELRIHVLINGCTDGTERVVRAWRPRHATVMPVVIARGDKANAWNHYVHDVAPIDAAIHVFTDGDMLVSPGSVAAFLRQFEAEPHANGCAGLPMSGRSREAFRAKLVNNREMAGNLYALRGSFVAEVRRRGIRLPFGIFGEDGLVAALVKFNLDMRGREDDLRITAAHEAGFAYPSLSPWRPSNWRVYRNRKMRYAVRRQQALMLYGLLKSDGTGMMPAHVVDLYRRCGARMRFSWNGLDTPFDWLAIRRIRRDIAADESVKEEDRAHLYS
ncbi:glycosyltransferase family 2 protein [Belnapia moabensis]|uniref:glycosyltransferase family 2 protein n=1 Tax=Belnapia moabensis TaxID=365533 RepID=UPI000694A0CC|nr:glycosyltransferase [Belnapia moabensis]